MDKKYIDKPIITLNNNKPADASRNVSLESIGSWGVVDCQCECSCIATMKQKIEVLESELNTLKSDLNRVLVLQQCQQDSERELPKILYGINYNYSSLFNVKE